MCIRDSGLFRSAEEIANYKNKDGELIQPGAQVGDIRYKDWNGACWILRFQNPRSRETLYQNYSLRIQYL